jgi:hypothetical protein
MISFISKKKTDIISYHYISCVYGNYQQKFGQTQKQSHPGPVRYFKAKCTEATPIVL